MDLNLSTSWGSEELGGAAREAGRGLLDRVAPPYDLTSDMLIVFARAPLAPLQRAFPQHPFLNVGGQALLAAWFSRITQAVYTDEWGRRVSDGGPGAALYHELNIAVARRGPSLFVPRIYATSARTIGIAWHYGMPKQPIAMSFAATGGHVVSEARHDVGHSFVRTRFTGGGETLGRLLDNLWPLRVGPAVFPVGSAVNPTLTASPHVQLAQVEAGHLDPGAPWLPEPTPFLPFGVYLAGFAMQLPPP